MSFSVDTKQYPTFWRDLSMLITRLMKQKLTGKVTLMLHQGVIKGVEVDRVYLSADELQRYERPV